MRMDLLIDSFYSPLGLSALVGFAIFFALSSLEIRRRERAKISAMSPRILRNLVLPVLAVHLIARFIFELSTDRVFIKITETILSVAVLSLFISLINYLLFSENNIVTRKASLPKLGRDVLNVILTLIFGAVVLSSVWGFNLGNLFAALGVSSLIIGLALQEPLSNLFHGISMLMARPFQRYDWVQIGDETGKVVDFTWRSVKILNRQNELVIIPNNSIGKLHIKNYSRPNRTHANRISIGFSYNDNPIFVKQALVELALNTEGILHDPAPQPSTLSYDDFYIKYGLKFYITNFEDQIVITDRLMTSLYAMAKQRGFEIPFPIRDVRMKVGPN